MMMPRRHTGLCLPALSLAFTGAGAKAEEAALELETSAPPAPEAEDVQYSYWKHPEYNAVVRAWKCEERGVCGNLHYIDTQDQKVRDMVGRVLQKKSSKVTDEDVLSFCGFVGDMNMKPDGENKWNGKIYWPFRKKSYGIALHEKSSGDLSVRGYLLRLPFIGMTVKLDPVDNPPPACKKPFPN